MTSGEDELNDTAEPTDKTKRRTWWIAAGFTCAGLAVGAAVLLSKKGDVGVLLDDAVKLAGRPAGGGGRSLDHRIQVREFPRQQAFGPGYSQRREIVIPAHSRGPKAA